MNTVWVELEETLGNWVRGQLVLMLAVAAGLAEVVPIVGPVLAFAPAVLIGLAAAPANVPLIVACAILVQLVESNVLVSRVMSHAVGISPLTVLIGIQVGAILYGLPGAFLAVPVAAAIQVILGHFLQTEELSQAEVHSQFVARKRLVASSLTIER